jgi:hypothetical protein
VKRTELKRRAELRADVEKVREFQQRGRRRLAAVSPIKVERAQRAGKRPPRSLNPGRGFQASPAQREKVRGRVCIVCAAQPCHPAHLLDRALGGGDEPEAVVPLCPIHHREYDEGNLDLLCYLEPHWRTELAYVVERHGLIRALKRITNDPTWTSAKEAA